MGLLSEDLQKKALLKIRTAELKKRKGRILRLNEKLLSKSVSLERRLKKKTNDWMNGRHLVWAQYNKRKKEFEKDAWSILKDETHDFILCHDSKSINVAAKAAKKNKAVFGFDLVENTFANLRGFEPGPLTRLKLRLKENKVGNLPFIISGDPYLTKEFQTRHPKADPLLILNGQETHYPRIRKNLRQRMGDTTNRPIVLYIGVLAPLRGIEQIIDAFARIKTDALLAIVGPGNQNYIDELSERITKLGLQDRAKILDGVPQSDVVPLAATATIGISPISTKTGNAGHVLNNKMFQYLAAGLPILSTNVPGPGGFIKKHNIGYIYEDEDVESLTEVIDKALNDLEANPEIRTHLLDVAREYTWEHQKQKLINYIREVEEKNGLNQIKETGRSGAEAVDNKNGKTMAIENTKAKLVQRTEEHKRPGLTARLKRYIRTLLRVPEDHKQAVLSEAILRRTHLLRNRMENIEKQAENLNRTLQTAKDNGNKLTPKQINNLSRYLRVMQNNINAQNNIVDVIDTNAKAVSNLQTTGSTALRPNIAFDKLFNTTQYPKIDKPASPYVLGRRSRIKVLYLNSVGGSMGRLSKAMMMHHKIESDCYVASYLPRRQLFYAHETNANTVFTHDEWKDFLKWAVQEYDIVQSSTLPLHEGVAECYDWLTETLGRRHIWRTTGFIHHYLRRDDVLPLSVYQRDTNSQIIPNPERYKGKTFKFDDTHMLTDPHIVFYSSPEKGAYLKGDDNYWLPSIRDPELYQPASSARKKEPGESVKIYVPYHRQAMFKGLDTILSVLEELREEGQNIDIITPENATTFWPDLTGFTEGEGDNAKSSIYPIPNHMMPRLFSRVDIVIDQIIMGCYGNTAIEAMLCEKPVIAQKRYKDFEGCPVVEANEETLKSVIIDLLDNPERWAKLGKAGRRYALKKHTPKHVSKIAADVYKMVMDEEKH